MRRTIGRSIRLRLVADQRGVALPMALLALIILSALVIGFSVLSATEPTIANNQLMTAQARALAEAGVERAMWALNNPTATVPPGIPASLTGSAPPPYDSSQLILVSTGGTTMGGFRVTVCTLSTTTAATFVQPASGGTVTVSVGSTDCMTPGQSVFVQTGGSYTVSSTNDSTTAVLTNSGYAGNAPPGTSIPSGSSIGSKLERFITAVGWVPNDTTNPSAHQKILVKAMFPPGFPAPPAALSVRGVLESGGNSLVDSRGDTSCGPKPGSLTTGATTLQGSTDIYGATDGDSKPNEIGTDVVTNVATSVFDQYILTDADINALRGYARASGTYLQGTVTFNAGNKIPNGLVFVDTVSGTNITSSTPSSDLASVSIQGNPPADPSRIFSGWLFVNGSLSIDGNFLMHGLIYAQNDVNYHGVGTGGVYGAVMSRNIIDLSSTSIDSDLLGNALINYNCAWARNGGGMFQTWAIESGSYKEVSD